MFKGEEAKIEMGSKKGGVPFQRDQMSRVIEVLGSVDREYSFYLESYGEASV